MDAAPTARTLSIQQALTWRITLLVTVVLALFALGVETLVLIPAGRQLAETRMEQTATEMEGRAGQLLASVETTLRTSYVWGQRGSVDLDDLVRFNEFFFPIIAARGEISSVILAEDTGREILLLLDPQGGWINRLSDPEAWGSKTYWLFWDRDFHLKSAEMREISYDARTRPWFKVAQALPEDGQIGWTSPYVFFTTREPGITASTRWRAPNGRHYLIGHDVKLLDLSRFTTHLTAGRHGFAAILAQDGRVMALPQDSRFGSDDEIKRFVLKPADELANPALAVAYNQWQAQGRPATTLVDYSAAGQPWLSYFRPTRVGNETFWLGVFAPEEDFVPTALSNLALFAGLGLLALAAGLIVATRIARQFAQPLRLLALTSERIGKLILDAPVTTQGKWRELRELFRSQETMRQLLQAAQAQQREAHDALEAKVQERTRALAENEATLASQLNLQRELIDTIPNPVFVKDAEGRFTSCNRAFEELFQIPRERLAGMDLEDFPNIPPATQERFRALEQKLIATGSAAREQSDLCLNNGSHLELLYLARGFQLANGQGRSMKNRSRTWIYDEGL